MLSSNKIHFALTEYEVYEGKKRQERNSQGDANYNIGNIVNIVKLCMVSDQCEIYRDNHLLNYIMTNHWGVHLNLI